MSNLMILRGSIPCYSTYDGLVLFIHGLSYLGGCLQPIHYWHVEIGKYELIVYVHALSKLDKIASLLPIHTEVNFLVNIESQLEQNGSHGRDTEFLVIH